MNELIGFLKVLIEAFPELSPKVKTAVDKWGQIHNVPTDHIIKSVPIGGREQVDDEIDRLIDETDLPEGDG